MCLKAYRSGVTARACKLSNCRKELNLPEFPPHGSRVTSGPAIGATRLGAGPREGHLLVLDV